MKSTILESFIKGKNLAHLFIFGLGYSAGYLAMLLLEKGWRVSATRRTSDAKAVHGINLCLFQARKKPEWTLPDASFILNSIPPDEKGDPVLRYFHQEVSQKKHRWLGYLSTTGVYGDHQGAWIDEESACSPTGERQKNRLMAERQWQEMGAHIFRLAGIYGPGRSVFEQIEEGRAKLVSKPGHRFGRIHVADIAGILLASMQHPRPGAIYNLADDEPAEPLEVTEYAFRLLGKPLPDIMHYSEAEMSPMARSFWRDHKKVSNAKIKKDLGYEFLYPSYREGLRAILAEKK